MKHLYHALLVALFYSTTSQAFEMRQRIGEQELLLCNKTDIKVMFLVDVGDAALYLKDCKPGNTEEYLLAIKYDRAFSADEFKSSSEVLMQRNIGDEQYQKLQPEVEAFNNYYQAVKVDDEYRIGFTKQSGLNLYKNDKLLANSQNPELAAAYFKVWFGERPFNKKMKRNLMQGIKPNNE